MNRLIYIIIFLAYVNSVVSQSICENCQRSLKSMSDNYIETAKKVDIYKAKTDALFDTIFRLRIKYRNLNQEFNFIKNNVIINNAKIEPVLSDKITNLEKEINNLKSSNKELNKEKSKYLKEIQKQKIEIREKINEINKSNHLINTFINQVNLLNTQLENEKIKVQELTDIINCIKEFELEKLQPDIKSVEALQEARRKYEYYTELKKNPNSKKAVKDSLISDVVSTYERYKSITKTKICGSYTLSFISDNLSGLDNLNIARIYGYNEGNAIDRIPGENKVNEATSKLMVAIGNALEKGFYETRSESRDFLLELNEIVDNIGNIAIVERRPGSENSEVLYNLKQIIELYNNEKYYELLVQFDKYQKYLTLNEIEKPNHAMIDEIKFMVGNTLLWNLADFNENSKNIFKGEWAKEQGDYKSIGRKLLTDVSNNKKANLKIRQLSLISKNKYYEN